MPYDATRRLLAARRSIFDRPEQRRRSRARRWARLAAVLFTAAAAGLVTTQAGPLTADDLRAALCGPLGLHSAGFGLCAGPIEADAMAKGISR